MNKERFIAIHSRRGYTVENYDNIVVISLGNYTAIWFFNTDGSLDESNPPIWTIHKTIP